MPGMAYLVFARSPHAHARLTSVDATAARSAPGVVAVLTGADVADASAVRSAWRLAAAGRRASAAEPGVRARQGPLRRRSGSCRRGRVERARPTTLSTCSRSTTSRCPQSPTLRRRSRPARRCCTSNSAPTWRIASNKPRRRSRGGLRARRRGHRLRACGQPARAARADGGARRRGALRFWHQRADVLVEHPDPAQPADQDLGRARLLDDHRVRVIAPDVGGGFGTKIEFTTEDVAGRHGWPCSCAARSAGSKNAAKTS